MAKKSSKKIRAAKEKPPQAPAQADDSQELVVFAFRLTRAERDLIHQAAGSAKASKMARSLLVAAAQRDEAAVKTILEGIHSEA
jgi:hypothetical protein